MGKPRISIIVAMDESRGIGKRNALLWHIPEELKHFKEITIGHPIIMGRKTFESIGRPLRNRTNIVITRDSNFKAEGCEVVHSLKQAIDVASKSQNFDDRRIFVIGGGQIFEQALEMGVVDKLYVTLVDGSFDATVFFPEYEHLFTKKVFEKEIKAEGTRFDREARQAKDRNPKTFKIKFLELEK